MKRLLVLPVLLLTLLVGNPAISADFQKGKEAYNKGDYATALRELKPLAEHGNAQAQIYIGTMYGNGQGVPQDYAKALKWYRLSGEKGYVIAQFNLGLIDDKGQGVPQDYAKAAKWFRLRTQVLWQNPDSTDDCEWSGTLSEQLRHPQRPSRYSRGDPKPPHPPHFLSDSTYEASDHIHSGDPCRSSGKCGRECCSA
jgi:hypothetical protein